jgi:hypothetical protein
MEKVKFYPQVSTNGNTIKYLMEMAKLLKEWFYVLNDENI